MFFIDTHTHLFVDQFDADRDETVRKALQAGVAYMLLPNIDVESISPMKQLAATFPGQCFAMMGLHPGSVNEHWEKELTYIHRELIKGGYIAIGEIGMDLYWDKTFVNEQRRVFRQQVEWAKELGLPIVIHAREAFEEIYAILDELNDDRLSGVFHCFTGTVDDAQRIMDYGGFKLGIGGVLTYKKSGLDEVLKEIPLDWLVLETDSPYLAPVPFRGKRNESSYLLHIAEKVADVKQVTLAEVASVTSANAIELFKLPAYVG
jgi:TatD DNase family protein